MDPGIIEFGLHSYAHKNYNTLEPKTSEYILIFIPFLISLSETYFNMPLFWSFFFLQYAETISQTDTYEIIDA